MSGSIHRVGAAVQGLEACNGWTFWHAETAGALTADRCPEKRNPPDDCGLRDASRSLLEGRRPAVPLQPQHEMDGEDAVPPSDPDSVAVQITPERLDIREQLGVPSDAARGVDVLLRIVEEQRGGRRKPE